ncbi:MAG: hypothetical protein QW739_01905 [Candidatus Odinarchaeota archaeon]
MNSKQILESALKSKLLKDPYVQKIWGLVNSNDLFNKSADYLKKLRKNLLREALDFFSRRSDYYKETFEKLDVNPKNADFQDLAKLAVPADMLRGEGHKQFLIKDAEPGGEYFTSSGTTGKTPVKIYRSPIDLAIMIKANTDLFEYVYGDVLEQNKGIALFMAAPELRHKLNFVAFVDLTLDNKKIPLLYGMNLVRNKDGTTDWQRLELNKENVVKFLKSKEEPKLFFTAPAGVYLMADKFDKMNFLKKLMYRLATTAPPVNLGKGGLVVTGGGTKGFTDLPSYDKIVSLSRKYFKAKSKHGEEQPAPFMDVLGMTETLTALIDRFGVMDKVPYPLSHVFLLDPKTFELIEEDEGKEGVLGIFNPFTTSWLELFYPGDFMKAHSSDRFYGKEYTYVRRFTPQEGWDLQRACGGTLEEMMSRK